MLFHALPGKGQPLQVKSRQTLQGDQAYAYPLWASQGRYLAYSSPGYKGLWLYDSEEGRKTSISDMPGAGYQPAFDGPVGQLYFRETHYNGLQKQTSLHAYGLAKGSRRVIYDGGGKVSPPRISNGYLLYRTNDTLRKKVLRAPKYRTTKWVNVYTANDSMVVETPSGRRSIAPRGSGHYLWVALSPNRKQVLFTKAGGGTWVCDLQGRILHEVGYLNAPKWFGNQWVIGMQDEDDGHRITASDVVAVRLKDGTTQNLTAQTSAIAMYPAGHYASGKMAWHTLQGTIEIITVEPTP